MLFSFIAFFSSNAPYFSTTLNSHFPFRFPSLLPRPLTNDTIYVKSPYLTQSFPEEHWLLCTCFVLCSVSFSESVFFLICMCLCMCLAPGRIVCPNGGVGQLLLCVFLCATCIPCSCFLLFSFLYFLSKQKLITHQARLFKSWRFLHFFTHI